MAGATVQGTASLLGALATSGRVGLERRRTALAEQRMGLLEKELTHRIKRDSSISPDVSARLDLDRDKFKQSKIMDEREQETRAMRAESDWWNSRNYGSSLEQQAIKNQVNLVRDYGNILTVIASNPLATHDEFRENLNTFEQTFAFLDNQLIKNQARAVLNRAYLDRREALSDEVTRQQNLLNKAVKDKRDIDVKHHQDRINDLSAELTAHSFDSRILRKAIQSEFSPTPPVAPGNVAPPAGSRLGEFLTE